MSRQSINTPCVGRCSTVFGDLVCRGCKRFLHEVVDWNRYSGPQKQAVWQRLDQLLDQVMRAHLEVFDPQLLADELQRQRVEVREQQPLHARAYQLLIRARGVAALPLAGIAPLPAFTALSLAQLRDTVDEAFFALAEAHYQRYIIHLQK